VIPKVNSKTIKVRFPDESRWEEANEDEFQFWPRTLWFDPGVSTGVTILWVDPAVLINPASPPIHRCVMAWWTHQLVGGRNSQVFQASELVKDIGGDVGLLIGIEDFILRTQVKDRHALEPVRWTHAFEFALWRGLKDYDGVKRRRGYVIQSPGDAKSRFTDPRLKQISMYTPGPDHIRDSTRHALLWLSRVRAENERNPGYFESIYGLDRDWFV